MRLDIMLYIRKLRNKEINRFHDAYLGEKYDEYESWLNILNNTRGN